jgi:DNA-cytosine methyltransferase
MKYISFFSGIGGFEYAIHNVIPTAICVGYSEIDPYARQVYDHHFPDHPWIGDLTTITKDQIVSLVQQVGGINLIVGGFPCQNLSRMAPSFIGKLGLEGPKSGLFWPFVQVIQWIRDANPPEIHLDFLIENNVGMKNIDRELITDTLQGLFSYPVYRTMIDSSEFGVQRRRRYYWTTWEIGSLSKECTQTWEDILESPEVIYPVGFARFNKCLFTGAPSKERIVITEIERGLWQLTLQEINYIARFNEYRLFSYIGWHPFPLYPMGKARTVTTSNQSTSLLIQVEDPENRDRWIVQARYLTTTEIERLFFLPDDWVGTHCSRTRSQLLLGNTVVTKVIEYILQHREWDSSIEDE